MSQSGLRVSPSLTIPDGELTWRFSRSSGPGGQSVNTTDSRVELSWDVAHSAVLDERQRTRLLSRLSTRITGGVLTIAASEYRAQLRNREAARERLIALITDALAPPPRPRRATKPTRGSKERRLRAKKQQAQTKQQRRRPDAT
ncbi:alternative ribosome rescue aminoacyl-tRNA hydrolase ArfB [Ruania halotolerans]|uniref:alternative ribosome rescue aminoacyl-tRNA hydrolase ArfB n=1 Tax=Ruania halotolerans TaxID=2897773 RepID=UPI001E604427|nr:alternative ribosome rescue aminoacyl-tRNA hydrolase ArfB [Ruania halotolerans]UFU06942.1 aminoacyl-tRNA hydrolase [Ruania halotolerans]